MRKPRDASGFAVERIHHDVNLRSKDGVMVRGVGVPTEYFIGADEIRSHRDITQWALHLLAKRWVTVEIVRNFMMDASALIRKDIQ